MNKSALFCVMVAILGWVGGSQALTGFDISKQMCEGGFTSQSLWNCFANDGYGFTVIEAINGGLGMTQTISSCVFGASNAGMYVSLYGWFCPNCRGMSDAYSTGYNTIMNLKSQSILPGVNYTYFYIDVEECDPDDDCWTDDYTTNQNYLVSLAQGAIDAGAPLGIYASPYEWKLLFGSDSWSNPTLTQLPLVCFETFEFIFVFFQTNIQLYSFVVTLLLSSMNSGMQIGMVWFFFLFSFFFFLFSFFFSHFHFSLLF